MKEARKVCMIDDDRGPIDLYEEALRMAFGDDQVVRFTKLSEAMAHVEAIEAGKESPHQLYLIDIMMPPLEDRWFEETNEGLTSGIFILQELRKAEAIREITKPAKVIMMSMVSNPDILERVGAGAGVHVIAKIEWMPSEIADKIAEVMRHE